MKNRSRTPSKPAHPELPPAPLDRPGARHDQRSQSLPRRVQLAGVERALPQADRRAPRPPAEVARGDVRRWGKRPRPASRGDPRRVFRHVRERATFASPSSNGIPPIRATEYTPAERYSAGLDLAQVNDFTVLTILDSRRNVVRVDRFNKMSWDQQIPRIVHALQLYGYPTCHVDATGVGSSIFERLRTAGANVRPYTMTNASKLDLVNNLAALLERGEITLPQPRFCRELIDELEAFAYSTTDAGNVRCAAPGNSHDDCVISLALAAWGARPGTVCRAYVGEMSTGPEPGPIRVPNVSGMHAASLGEEGASLRSGLLGEIRRR